MILPGRSRATRSRCSRAILTSSSATSARYFQSSFPLPSKAPFSLSLDIQGSLCPSLSRHPKPPFPSHATSEAPCSTTLTPAHQADVDGAVQRLLAGALLLQHQHHHRHLQGRASRPGAFDHFRWSVSRSWSNWSNESEFTKSFCESQFPHKSVNLFFIVPNAGEPPAGGALARDNQVSSAPRTPTPPTRTASYWLNRWTYLVELV